VAIFFRSGSEQHRHWHRKDGQRSLGPCRFCLDLAALVVCLLLRVAPQQVGKSASMAERVLAGFWLLTRRVVCFFAAAFFLMVSVFGGMAALKERSGFGLLGVIFALVMAAACIWWGLYGAGRVRTFGDARSTHEERKRRYGWK